MSASTSTTQAPDAGGQPVQPGSAAIATQPGPPPQADLPAPPGSASGPGIAATSPNPDADAETNAPPNLVSEEAPAAPSVTFSDIEELKEYLQDWAGDHGFAISCTSSRGGDYYTLRCKRARKGGGGCPWTMVVRRFFFEVDKSADGRLAWTTTVFKHDHPPMPRGSFAIHRRPSPEVREYIESACERGEKPRVILNAVRRMDGCAEMDIDTVYYIVAQWRRRSRAESAIGSTSRAQTPQGVGASATRAASTATPRSIAGGNAAVAATGGEADGPRENGGSRGGPLSPDSDSEIDPTLGSVLPDGPEAPDVPEHSPRDAPSDRVDARGRAKPWCNGCGSYIRHHGTCPREVRKRKAAGESTAIYVDRGMQTEPLDIFKDPAFARQIAAILLTASEDLPPHSHKLTPVTIDINVTELRAKYAEERDKRLNAAAGRNFKVLDRPGEFVDPHMPVVPREPVADHVEFCYIGGGFSGLLTAARVKEAGIKSVRIVDRAGDFGGVWYWNRYPGAMCDTAAMVYLPLLEETGHMPTKKYVMGPEIQEQCGRIGRMYNLYDDALFHTDILSVVWEEEGKRWRIKTDRGDDFTATFVGIGSGPLSVAQLPDIPGIEKFKGKQFHTSRWDYEYTGGDRYGAEMNNLADKRVGIVGTGATAVQCIPALSRDSGDLYVFQRTPSAVDKRGNHPIDPEWFKEVTKEPGWQARWLESFSDIWGQAIPDPNLTWQDYPDLVNDGWTNLALRWRDAYRSIPREEFGLPTIMAAMEAQDNQTMERIRQRVDEVVTDKDKARDLKAWYRQMCKRPCFHDDYLQAFNKESAHLIDTNGEGVSEVTETGVVVNGKHYELDCLVWASGFQFLNADVKTRMGYDVKGRNGTLSETWSEKAGGGGMRTLHGLQAAGFPNLFFQQLPQTGFLGSNLPNNFVPQAANIAALISHAKEKGYSTVDAKPEAQEAWCDNILKHSAPLGTADCTPGYYNNEGNVDSIHVKLNAGYPGGCSAFTKLMEQWRTPGPEQFAGVTFE